MCCLHNLGRFKHKKYCKNSPLSPKDKGLWYLSGDTLRAQQQNQPPRPPQQHQLQMLHISRYIQKERQNRPGFPLGCA